MADTQDPYAVTPEFVSATDNIKAQQRGALAALAKGGSQGLAAYNAAIAQSGGLKQAALSAAAHRASLIGGTESQSAAITNPIVQGANIAQANLSAGSAALQNFNKANSAATGDYFRRTAAAVPANELAFLRSQLSKGSSNSMSEADRNAQILGSAQQDAAEAAAADAKAAEDFQTKGTDINSRLAAAKAAQDEAYKKWASASKASAVAGTPLMSGGVRPGVSPAERKQLLADASAKEKAYKALQAEASNYATGKVAPKSVKSLSEYAQQQAINNNLTPAQARVLYGEGGTKISEFQQQQVKNTHRDDITQVKAWAGGQAPDAETLKAGGVKLTKGKLAQEDFITLVTNAPNFDDTAKQYLIGTYAKSFKTQKQLKKG